MLFAMQALDGLNQYDILEHCYHSRAGVQGNKSNELPESFKQLGMSSDKPLPVRKRMFGRAWPFRAPVKGGLIPLWPQLMESGGVQCTVSAETNSISINLRSTS